MKPRVMIVSAITLIIGALWFGFGLFQAQNKVVASWHMINVNGGRLQGDAHLLTTKNVTAMIDAGDSRHGRRIVAPYLKDLGITTIDHFFVSHPHKDHYGGLAGLLHEGIKIRRVYFRMPIDGVRDRRYDEEHFRKYLKLAASHGAKLIEPKIGDQLIFDPKTLFNSEVSIKLVHYQEELIEGAKMDVNDMSLLLKLHVGGSTVMFPGDLNLSVGTFLSGKSFLKSDFLKMPHHGGSGIAPNSFFDTVNPEFVLVPGQKRKWCGDRGKQAREWTWAKEVPTWVNGINGHVVVTWTKNVVSVTPEISDGSCFVKNFGDVSVSY